MVEERAITGGGDQGSQEDRAAICEARADSHERVVRECLLTLGASPTAISNLIAIIGQSQVSVFWKTGEVYFENFGLLKWELGGEIRFKHSQALLENAYKMQRA